MPLVYNEMPRPVKPDRPVIAEPVVEVYLNFSKKLFKFKLFEFTIFIIFKDFRNHWVFLTISCLIAYPGHNDCCDSPRVVNLAYWTSDWPFSSLHSTCDWETDHQWKICSNEEESFVKTRCTCKKNTHLMFCEHFCRYLFFSFFL